MATYKGHLQQTRKRKTKPVHNSPPTPSNKPGQHTDTDLEAAKEAKAADQAENRPVTRSITGNDRRHGTGRRPDSGNSTEAAKSAGERSTNNNITTDNGNQTANDTTVTGVRTEYGNKPVTSNSLDTDNRNGQHDADEDFEYNDDPDKHRRVNELCATVIACPSPTGLV